MNTAFQYVTGGTLHPNSRTYVERSADREFWEAVRRGEFCYVLTSRQMGKSSLMVRTAFRLRAEGVKVAAVDLTGVGQHLTPGQWYVGLLTRITEQLGMEEELEESLDRESAQLGVRWFFRFLADRVLRRHTGPVAVFIDEIDVVKSLPFSSDEFMAGIRECYNRRALDERFQRLTFCLFGVSTPGDLIKDTRVTPFNVGTRIVLRDFTEEEARGLAAGLQGVNGNGEASDASRQLMRRVLYWTHGHPYLTQRLCAVLSERLAANGDRSKSIHPDRLVDAACAQTFLADQAREQDTNLVFVSDHILRSPTDLGAVLDLYRRVLRERVVARTSHQAHLDLLRLSGLVRQEGRAYVVRNRIYQQVFDQTWISEHMPESEARRERRAFWAGATLAAVVALALVLLVAAVGRERVRWLRSDLLRAEAQRDVEAFFMLSPDMLAILDNRGHFTRLNPLWTDVLGYPLRELLDKSYTNFVHPDDRASTLQEASQLSPQRIVYDFTNRYVHRDRRHIVTLVWRANVDTNGTIRASARPVFTNTVSEPLR